LNSKNKYCPKIFFIGFNKTATTAFHRFFLDNNYKSFHNKNSKKNLALTIRNNLENKLPILHSINDAHCYSDLMYVDDNEYIEGHKYFKEIYNEYPNSYYVLQTRNLEDWIKSRICHIRPQSLLARTKSAKKMSCTNEVIEFWLEDIQNHIKEVKKFFYKNNKFLEYNIDNDNVTKLISFLKHDYILNETKWKKHNVSRRSKNYRID